MYLALEWKHFFFLLSLSLTCATSNNAVSVPTLLLSTLLISFLLAVSIFFQFIGILPSKQSGEDGEKIGPKKTLLDFNNQIKYFQLPFEVSTFFKKLRLYLRMLSKGAKLAVVAVSAIWEQLGKGGGLERSIEGKSHFIYAK